jgi:hypothetical protein
MGFPVRFVKCIIPSYNTDAENRADFGQFGFWDAGSDDQHAIVAIEFDLPKPKPVPVVKPMNGVELKEYHRPPADAVPASIRPEYLGCQEGYVTYRDHRLAPQTVQLYDDSGRLLATVPNVKYLHVAPYPE